MLVANGIFARFTVMSAHMTILIMFLFDTDIFVQACRHPSDQNTLDRTRFIIALSISIALLVFELIIFLIGPSLFRHRVTFANTILHSAGAIALSFMIFTKWCSVNYWIIFAVCSCVPFFIEVINAIGYNLAH